jgi:hypothetical protein
MKLARSVLGELMRAAQVGIERDPKAARDLCSRSLFQFGSMAFSWNEAGYDSGHESPSPALPRGKGVQGGCGVFL